MTALHHSRLGVAWTSYMMVWQPQDTLEFLEHCHAIGAAGIQAPIAGDPHALRAKAENHGMYIEAAVRMPEHGDTSAFEHSLQQAQAAGALAIRTDCLGTRRYETFDNFSDWQQHLADTYASIEAARPLLDRYRIPLGIENHKDWTAGELASLMQRYGGEYLGVCLDFGNNIALLDDPVAAIKQLAPYAVCTHFKDMAVETSEDGFLLSEVVLGSGYLDLPHALSIVREARPGIRVSLEMITRDPLPIPCRQDRYWATFPERNAERLAKTLRFVQEHPPKQALPYVAHLPRAEQAAIEDQNVIACLRYAQATLNL